MVNFSPINPSDRFSFRRSETVQTSFFGGLPNQSGFIGYDSPEMRPVDLLNDVVLGGDTLTSKHLAPLSTVAYSKAKGLLERLEQDRYLTLEERKRLEQVIEKIIQGSIEAFREVRRNNPTLARSCEIRTRAVIRDERLFIEVRDNRFNDKGSYVSIALS